MAEEKTKKIEKTETVTKKVKVKTNPSEAWAKMPLNEMRKELQKLTISIKTGSEKNTSLVKKLRKQISIALTKNNQK